MAEIIRRKGVIFKLTAAHVPDMLEQIPSGFELHSPKTLFLSARPRHLFTLIDPTYCPASQQGLFYIQTKLYYMRCHQNRLNQPFKLRYF